MAPVKLPWVDTDALAERLRDVDLSRLAELGDELRHLDVAEGLKRLDIDALKRLDVPEGIKHLDMDALKHLDIDALKRLDLEGLRHLAEGVEAPELDLAALRKSPVVRRVQTMLGRPPKRNLWDSWSSGTRLGSTVMAGAVIVVAGAAIGGLVAWLYQPGKGEKRRSRIRRRVRRLLGKVQGASRA